MSLKLDEICLSSRILASGRRVVLREDTVQLPNGVIGTREIVEHPKVVVIAPLVSDTEIILIRQYRSAAAKVLFEVPAGVIEENEEVNAAAQRELREEIGYRSNQLIPVFHAFPTPGFCTEYMYFFVAKELVKDPLAPDIDEIIEPIIVSIESGLDMIKNGSIIDLKTIAMIYSLKATA